MADDELEIPQVPEPKPDDAEDVSWALSTAEAMWARGDHLEGIKWVRKAAEAASDAEHDMRSLALAKAAAELAAMIARRSAPEPPSSRTSPGGPPSLPPARPAAPPPLKPAPPGSKQVRAAPPVPSKPPPPAPASSQRAAPRPLSTDARSQGPAPGKGILSNRVTAQGEKKGRRRSRESLEAEAHAAGVLETAPQLVLDADAAHKALGATDEMPALTVAAEPSRAKRRGGRSESEGAPGASAKALSREKSAEEWDDSPTQSLTGEELPVPSASSPGSSRSHARTPQATPSARAHDPAIQTTQAVRVVVWRDASGVHVAPAGTAVSALKIDAVLVALDPNADLTAWLTQNR